MFYSKKELLTGNKGNNALSYEERKALLGKEPSLVIPSRRTGSIEDISLGTETAFEEVVEGKLYSKPGLAEFIEFINPINNKHAIIFDNHNHALFFWAEAIEKGYVQKGATLIHIDQHKDMREPASYLEAEPFPDLQRIYDYSNQVLNVGNFIKPAMKLGIVGDAYFLDNEPSFFKEYPTANTIVDIDLDLFAQEMDHMDFESILPSIRRIVTHADFLTVATSPFFIDQKRAIEWLHRIFSA